MTEERFTIILYGERERRRAEDYLRNAPPLSVVTFQGPKRSVPQNAKLHAMITDIATQLRYYNQKLSVADWKLVFLAGLKSEMRIVPNLDGDGFVNLGRKTSRLSREEFGLLIDLVEAYGRQNGVEFSGEAATHA